jgi:hypothetical protein
MTKKEEKVESRIVQAVGSAGGGASPEFWTAQEIQDVMTKATEEAAEKGISDPDKIREFKLKAREAFKTERREAFMKAAKRNADG